jgi:hypothetical protein
MLLSLYRPYVSWETFMISAKAKAGRHLIRFVDDHGFFNGQDTRYPTASPQRVHPVADKIAVLGLIDL